MRRMSAGVTLVLLSWPLAAASQGLDLSASTSPPVLPPGCSAAAAGTSVAYGCANPNTAAATAQTARGTLQSTKRNTPPPALGIYNQAALREQFGNRFGKSTVPPQPPH